MSKFMRFFCTHMTAALGFWLMVLSLLLLWFSPNTASNLLLCSRIFALALVTFAFVPVFYWLESKARWSTDRKEA